MKRSKMGTRMGSKMYLQEWQEDETANGTNKEGKEIPFFAADGKGKMMAAASSQDKGYFKGGKTKGMAKGGKTKGYAWRQD